MRPTRPCAAQRSTPCFGAPVEAKVNTTGGLRTGKGECGKRRFAVGTAWKSDRGVLGTASGVLRLGDGAPEPLGLEGHSVTACTPRTTRCWPGPMAKVFRSADGGRRWERVALPGRSAS